MEIYVISLRMTNHAGPAGYDRLTEFVGGKILHPIEKWELHQRIITRIFRGVIERSNLLCYHRVSFYQELTAAWRWSKRPKEALRINLIYIIGSFIYPDKKQAF